MAQDAHRLRAKLKRSSALRYALAPVWITVALLLEISVVGRFPVWSSSPPLIHPTGLFQICIVAAAWFGGAGPGLLAALLATLILPHVIAMNYPLIAGVFDLPRSLAFGITGLAVAWAPRSAGGPKESFATPATNSRRRCWSGPPNCDAVKLCWLERSN